MGAKPKKPKAYHRPADTREHSDLIYERHCTLDLRRRHEVRDRRLDAGLLERLRRKGEHENGDGRRNDRRRPREREIGRHRRRERRGHRNHDAPLAGAIGYDATYGREQRVGHEPRRDHTPVQGARSSKVKQVQGQHELQDLHTKQAQRL